MTTWHKIIERHSAAVWQTSYRLLGNHEDAADCCQETFLSMLKIKNPEKVQNISAFLTVLCTRRAIDRLRDRYRHSRRCEMPDWTSVAGSSPSPAQNAETSELSAKLRIALAAIPPQQAKVFCLRVLNDMSYRDIAKQLGIKTSAVGVLLHRARTRLEKLLSATVEAGSTGGQS